MYLNFWEYDLEKGFAKGHISVEWTCFYETRTNDCFSVPKENFFKLCSDLKLIWMFGFFFKVAISKMFEKNETVCIILFSLSEYLPMYT